MVTKLNKLENTHKEDFYISDSTECVYQPDQKERKLFTFIKGSKDRDFYNLLISRGFRRSQNILYNQVCEGCNKCIPIRIKTNNFKAKKNQKRILSKGKIFQRNITEKATYEQFYLFKEYLNYKHPDSEMNDMIFADYYSMIKNSGIDTKIIEYRLDNILISSCITDFLDDALSMVYSFYSPYLKKYSLGKFMILDHIVFSEKYNKELIYLGYWISGCKEMEYKKDFISSEILINGEWISYEKENKK